MTGAALKLEVAAIDWPDQIPAQVHHPVVAESGHDLAGLRIEAEQTVPAGKEDPERIAVTPQRHPAMTEAAAQCRHAIRVGARIENPAHRARLGVQRGDPGCSWN